MEKDEKVRYKKIVENSTTAILVIEKNTKEILFVNDIFRQLFSLAESDTSGKSLHDLPTVSAMLKSTYINRLPREEHAQINYLNQEGKYLLVDGRRMEWGDKDACIFYVTDETREYEQRRSIQNLIDYVPGGIMILDIIGDTLYTEFLNKQYYETISSQPKNRGKYAGVHAIEAVHPDDQIKVQEVIYKMKEGMEKGACVLRIKNDREQYVWVRVTASVVQRTKESMKLYCSLTDVSKLMNTQAELKKTRKQLYNSLESAKVASWSLDVKNRCIVQTPVSQKWYGTREKIVRDVPETILLTNLIHPDSVEDLKTLYQSAYAGEQCSVEIQVRRVGDENYHWERVVYAPVFNAEGDFVESIGSSLDITEEKKRIASSLSEIKERRRVDRMTGLMNREPAEEDIEMKLCSNSKGAFFFMDIDNFKLINDTHGHPAGDQALINFANILKDVFDDNSVISRLGGDEFVVFVPRYHSMEALRGYADKILACSGSIVDDPILADKIGVSIGIAIAPEDGISFESLYNNADKGQYFAKRNGKNRYSFYERLDEKQETRDEGANINTLRRMIQSVQIDRGAFLVKYEAFSKVYQFLERNLLRTKQNTQIELFTLNRNASSIEAAKKFEHARAELEKAIRFSLRTGDIMMDFIQNQIAVLLVNCDATNGISVAERILSVFYENNPDLGKIVSYESGSINEVTN